MTLLNGIAIVIATIVIGSIIYVVAGRFSPEGGRENRVPTSVYAVTAGAMSLLIAFTLSLTFERYVSAQTAAAQDAEAVLELSRDATYMSPKVRDELRNQLVCYAEETINIVWPALRRGDTRPQPAPSKTLDRMEATIAADLKGADNGLDEWATDNDMRSVAHVELLQIAGSSVPPILWMLLIAGSLITVGSLVVYADRAKPAWGHVVVIIGPLFIASAALVVIAFFDHPYTDTPGGIQPTAMELVLQRMTESPVKGLPLPKCPHPVPQA